MRKRAQTLAGRAAIIVRAGLIAGVLVGAVVFPVAALTGLTAKAGADLLNGLSDELELTPPAQTTYVYASDAQTLLTAFYEEHRKYTPIQELSPYILQAIVASEDARFFQHRGVDPRGVVRAFVVNQQSGGVSQGASTLTMQYVRATLRDGAESPDEVRAATEQTPARKIREMRLAMELEKRMPKEEILERYLNSAYYGHQAYGIYSAAEVFFSKRPKDLTLPEAAMLAGVVKAPSEYDPGSSDSKAATDRRNYVIDRMTDLGYVSAELAAKAKQEPIKLNLSRPPNGCLSIPEKFNSWGYLCDYLRSWWRAQPAFGDNPAQREAKLRRGGYKIVLSLDPKIQDAAHAAVVSKVPPSSPYALGVVAVEPRTGVIKAMAVNRNYSLDQSRNGPHSNPNLRKEMKGNYPNTVNALLGGSGLPGYQAGSTFKFFTLLTALENGYKLSHSYYSPARLKSRYWVGGGPGSCDGYWCPVNASGAMTGRQDMRTGFGKSVNTYFVQLIQDVGAEKVVRMAERLGLRWHTDVDSAMAAPDRANTWGSFTLGVADTTPLEMANAYATAAGDGLYCEPLPVLSITNPDGSPVTYAKDGKTIDVAAPRCRQAVSEAVARAATDAARCPVGDRPQTGGCGGWSTADFVRGAVGRPVAGKTGTTDDTRSAWFAGYTPDLSAASFMADPDNPFHFVGDGNANAPIQAVAETLRNGLEGRPARDFPPVPASMR
jgi:membrane peptidoglycan carboxypeptidase